MTIFWIGRFIVFVKKSVAVLIINFKATALLARCLECIARQDSMVADVIVLDNGVDEPIPEEFYSRFPSVQFHKSEKNIGFAAGNNLLFQKTKGYEWIALVNPDAFLEPDWLSKMLSTAMAHPEYSFFASRLVKAANHEILDGDGDTMHVSGLAWRDGHGQAISQGAIEPCEAFSPCAAAALYRRDVVESVEGFDEDFFCYFEDVDLGFWLRLAGHRWMLLPAHIVLNLVTIIWFSLQGQGAVILKAKWDALCGISRMWKKRRKIQKHRTASAGEIWKVLNKSFLPRLFRIRRRCI